MEGVICPTDSRFRGDQRLFEEGKNEEADAEKKVLEQMQRAARKELEQKNETFKTKFFDPVEVQDIITG